MELKLPITDSTNIDSIADEITGCYLVSARWTMINDKNVTFVRNKAFGYCYNLKWAGPLSKFDADIACQNSKTTFVISHSLLEPFLVHLNDELSLPNSIEVRKLIGLDDNELQLAK
ncbi:hypothetical protein [Flavobacterium frigoris]|uniref:Uncharacterized protein n=1 Tax=Flavobacterium frigoris TaxID=229204 RepID=A0A1H9PG04_FLAFI|nr:hypothetical protein [Flavobacterium frigoris]SER47030.1 hypothetical protein SAMN05444355_11331 [Flavobacterium frigoris]